MSGHARLHRARLATAILAIALSAIACGASSNPEQPPSSPASATMSASPVDPETTPIDGVYAMTITDADAAGAGIPKSKFDEFVGDYELTMVRGQIQISFTHGVTVEVLRGTYAVEGGRLAVSGNEGPELGFDWELEHGKLKLDLTETDHPDERSLDELLFTTHTWERIE